MPISKYLLSESVVTFLINAVRAGARKKICSWMKNRQPPPLYIQSARYSQIVEMKEGSDSWERESSGLESRERCYQRDEGTRRSLRIIESYDCLFRASVIRDCSSRRTRRSVILCTYVSADRSFILRIVKTTILRLEASLSSCVPLISSHFFLLDYFSMDSPHLIIRIINRACL